MRTIKLAEKTQKYEGNSRYYYELVVDAVSPYNSKLYTKAWLAITRKRESAGMVWDYGYERILDIVYFQKPRRYGTQAFQKELEFAAQVLKAKPEAQDLINNFFLKDIVGAL